MKEVMRQFGQEFRLLIHLKKNDGSDFVEIYMVLYHQQNTD